MVNEILNNPKVIGCLNCSPVPNVELEPNEDIMFMGFLGLKISGLREKWFHDGVYRREPLTVKKIMKKWGKAIKKGHHTFLYVCGTLHSETYEYDKKTDKWFLVEQGRGFM